MIVTPQRHAASLSELEQDALGSLGPTLAAVTRAIEVVIRPERVYWLCLLRKRVVFIFIFFLGRRGFCRNMPPLIQQIMRFQGRDCWIGLGERSNIRFRAETVRMIFRELDRNV